MPTEYYALFAPDLDASAHWYTDVLGREPTATAEGLRYDLDTGATLVLTAQGQPAKFILPVPQVAAYRQRFEQRVTVSGEDQGRLVEAEPHRVILVDPAGNRLQFVAGPSTGQPVC